MALTSIASVVLILVFVGKEALPVLTSSEVHKEVTFGVDARRRVARATSGSPSAEVPKYNIVPLFVGTLKVTLVSLIFAVPLSIAAAVYVAEFAGKRSREIIKPAIELLAGVPSVVVGFFALVVLATWVQTVFGTEHRLNTLVAGVALSFATMPVVFSVSEDALRAVPDSFRQAAIALGSTKSQVVLRVVLPAAAPGIAASVVLGFGRAIGETMIVILATGNAAILDWSLGHSVRTVTATIAQELGEVVVGSAHYHVLFFLGALLFLSTLAVNVGGEQIVSRMRRKLVGAEVTDRARDPSAAASLSDRVLHVVTLLATMIILAMLATIVIDILRGGAGMLSWELLERSSAERHDGRRNLPCDRRHRRAHVGDDGRGGAGRASPPRSTSPNTRRRAHSPPARSASASQTSPASRRSSSASSASASSSRPSDAGSTPRSTAGTSRTGSPRSSGRR